MTQTVLGTPLFGLGLTLLAGVLGLYIKAKSGWKLFNPMLFGMLLIISVLLFFNIPYADYQAGGDLILKLLGPITVVLAVPLYQHHDKLRRHAFAILLGVAIGSLSALLSVWLFAWAAGLDLTLIKSLLPRSITTPIGIAASEMLDGLVGLTVLSIVITGTFGAIAADRLFKMFGITDPVARGVALGTSAHAIGTGKAFEYGQLEGAMSGLSIAIAGVSTILWLLLFQLSGVI